MTAVKWLIDELELDMFATDEEMEIIIKAKEMEKKQIILAHGIKDTGVNNMKCVTGEQYYNETFKQEQ
jgi:hypothetical protein